MQAFLLISDNDLLIWKDECIRIITQFQLANWEIQFTYPIWYCWMKHVVWLSLPVLLRWMCSIYQLFVSFPSVILDPSLCFLFPILCICDTMTDNDINSRPPSRIPTRAFGVLTAYMAVVEGISNPDRPCNQPISWLVDASTLGPTSDPPFLIGFSYCRLHHRTFVRIPPRSPPTWLTDHCHRRPAQRNVLNLNTTTSWFELP